MEKMPSPLWTNSTSLERMTGTWRNALPYYKNLPSPCHGACPVDGEIAQWLLQVNKEDHFGAWITLVDNNPFPSIAGRICHHPCETSCNRTNLDETVGICSLERFVGDKALADGWAFAKPQEERPEKIAIIGGGPAGLSAAYQLRRRGFQVDLFEARPALGGLLRYGIPAYRLDKSILDQEIARIIDLGITTHLNAEVLDAKALKKLRENYDAVYLATGASKPKALPGLDYCADYVLDSAEFLAATNAGEKCELGEHLVVIGGGSAAMDVARTARRLGHRVSVLSLEPDELLPAQRAEVDEAKEEGIGFICSSMLKSVVAGDDGITLRCTKIDFKPGETRGAFSMSEVDGGTFDLTAHAIIPAIGQDADIDRWTGMLNAQGPVVATDAKWQTETDGIFAGGDLASMDRFVTQAIGMGKHAAVAIAGYVCPDQVVSQPDKGAEVPYKAINTAYHPKEQRNAQAHLMVDVRLQSFKEVQLPLPEAEAIKEAGRCFTCGTCTLCDNCFLYCPDVAIKKVDGGYTVDADYCKGCGLCVAECPTGSIAMQEES